MIFRAGYLSFRHALPSDGLFVADCLVDWPTPHTTQCVMNDVAEWAAASRLATRPMRLRANQQETFIVNEAGAPVGVVRYEQHGEKTCYVTHHLVHPNERRRGLHTRIVPAAFAYAFAALNVPICRFDVLKSAIAVLKVGEKYGYVPENERRTDVGNDVIQMWFRREQWLESEYRTEIELI